jgi:hypothetical protein
VRIAVDLDRAAVDVPRMTGPLLAQEGGECAARAQVALARAQAPARGCARGRGPGLSRPRAREGARFSELGLAE